MKFGLILLTALSLLSSPVAAQSEWVERIGEIAPANIALTDVEEMDGYVTIKGTAKSNSDIFALMRAIQKSKLGYPELQQVEQTDVVSHFVLRIKLKT